MRYCKKCGAQLSENDKFCASCGSPFNTAEEKSTDSSSKKTVKIICICVALIAVLCTAFGVFYKTMLTKKKIEESKKIEISSIKIDEYPNVSISIKAENFEDEISEEKLSIKENDTYAKDLNLIKEQNGKYIISYKSGDSSTEKKKVIIAYDDNGNEKTAEAYYTPKEKDNSSEQSVSGSDRIVQTHDPNEEDIIYAINNYEDEYIWMINNRNTSYIKSSIDLSGSLLTEFDNLIKSYDEQDIKEDLIDHTIEGTNKINENQYEVTVYERYDIYYGLEECEKIIEYRTIYVVNNTKDGFKVGSIKNITQLSSQTV